MTPNPIQKVLSTLRLHHVQFLLIGGQACVFYGAAEFSRDTDIILLSEAGNLEKLSRALLELRADCIAVPPFSASHLDRGHAVHFRCHHSEADGIRIDVMSVLRGVAPFAELWKRRTTIETESGEKYELVSLPDLVQTKKTQRSKDWLMIRRLVESHYAGRREHPDPLQIAFWLKELRTIPLLMQVAKEYPDQLHAMIEQRPLLSLAEAGDEKALATAIEEEEEREREADRRYWAPLISELERMRHSTERAKQ